MPVEDFAIADSNDPDFAGLHTGSRVARTFAATTPYSICREVASALLAAGWTLVDSIPATGSLVLPAGLPWVPEFARPDPPIPEIDKPIINDGIHICTIAGDNPVVAGAEYHFYNPYRNRPDLSLTGRVWLAMGDTMAESFDALTGAIGLSGWVVIGVWQQSAPVQFAGWWHIDFNAPVAGLEWNDVSFGGLYRFDAATTSVFFLPQIWPYYTAGSIDAKPNNSGPAGGALRLRSSQGDSEPYKTLDVWIGVHRFTPHSAAFDFVASTGGNIPGFYLGTGSPLSILANQFQFFVFPMGVDPNSVDGSRTLLCIFPWWPEGKGVTYAAIVSGPGGGTANWRRQAAWGAGKTAVALNGGFGRWIKNVEYAGMKPGLYPVKSPYPVLDPGGLDVVVNAWVGAPIDPDDHSPDGQACVVGKVWDAFIVQSNARPLDSRVMWSISVAQLGYFICVLRQLGFGYTACSLWVAFYGIGD